jgi:hypothetical protein
LRVLSISIASSGHMVLISVLTLLVSFYCLV